ncbi:MAG: Hsp33 family molecular chaperone HslO [Ignavibacteria bacterium]|jgi:molecular chaperone Hsp33|nr:Hsp33 family molecular chaperone HslO [Ignavibacteria bacterium]
MIEDTKKKFVGRDRYIRVISRNGFFRAVAVKNTVTAQQAQKSHNLNEINAYYLAKTLTAAAMVSAFLKGEERVVVDVTGNGAISKLYAEALQVGECRGFVRSNPDFNREIEKMEDVIGDGYLTVSRILYGRTEPVSGIVPIQNGDIASDLAYYFVQSEQVNSAVILDASFDNNNIIACSGGIVVQAMPGALQEEIDAVVTAITEIEDICSEIESHLTLEELLKEHLPFDFDVIKNRQLDFFCRCNLSNYKHNLLMLPIKEVEEMQKDKQNELVCQFCNKHYYLSDEDFKEMLDEMYARNN